jgi:hypothetical protein
MNSAMDLKKQLEAEVGAFKATQTGGGSPTWFDDLLSGPWQPGWKEHALPGGTARYCSGPSALRCACGTDRIASHAHRAAPPPQTCRSASSSKASW